MRYIKLIMQFLIASSQQEMAYSFNLFIHLVYSLLNLGIGIAGLGILFNQVESIKGWDYESTLALLGIYLFVSAIRGLFIGPSLEALSGMDGEIMAGKFDFTLLRPINLQFLASFRYWQPFAIFDLLLGIGVTIYSVTLHASSVSIAHLISFGLALSAGLVVMYAIILAFSALVFWSPGFMFTWVFDGLFQLARYPIGLYPGWARQLLTWIIPVGVITTLPAQALMGKAALIDLLAAIGLAFGLYLGAGLLFKFSVRRYSSASS